MELRALVFSSSVKKHRKGDVDCPSEAVQLRNLRQEDSEANDKE